MSKGAPTSVASLRAQAQGRITLLRSEVDREPWAIDHKVAMACISLEETLRFGIDVYEALHRMDEGLRDAAIKGEIPYTPELAKFTKDLFKSWLEASAKVEDAIRKFEGARYTVQHAEQFRKRREEALWILKPAREAFADPRFAEARDRAIEAARAGKCHPEPD